MIPTSDLLTVRFYEAVVILLFPSPQQLIVAAALDLAPQGIGVRMAETTKRFFFPKIRITHHVCSCCMDLLLLEYPTMILLCGSESSFPRWGCWCREEPVSPWSFSWQLNVLLWKVSEDFASPWLEEENLSGSVLMSYGRFFHNDAVAFLKIGLPSATRSIWILLTYCSHWLWQAAVQSGVLYPLCFFFFLIYWKSVGFNLSGFVFLSSDFRPAALE